MPRDGVGEALRSADSASRLIENTVAAVATARIAGDHAQVETPVPIPNTADKHLGPMVVRPARE
jgi:hypothetical protein